MQKTFKLLLLLCAVACMMSACKKDDEAPIQDRDEFFIATIDGAEKNITYAQNAYNISYVGKHAESRDTLGAIVSYTRGPGSRLLQDVPKEQFLGGLDVESNEQPTIYFGQNEFTEREWSLEQLTSFNSIFETGSYPYLDTDTLTAEVPGIEIVWQDENEQEWSTLSGSQSGSSFSVSKVDEFTTSDGDAQNKVEGTFNCTLYDGNGNSVNVTNGEFFMTFQLL